MLSDAYVYTCTFHISRIYYHDNDDDDDYYYSHSMLVVPTTKRFFVQNPLMHIMAHRHSQFILQTTKEKYKSICVQIYGYTYI